ncbi:MAG: 2Fe-2S iron-sulfur cluster binding domain-containing protein [Cyanothece sp. SIO2G6]|nr:2Fe-2S iron-sulfur cluster binding domain-containing protein [Cyanothece sp. SIO2G6]
MANAYTVKITHQETEHTITVPADRKILEVALEQGIELPYSCNAGVCTTCAALVVEGAINQSDAAGIGPSVQEAGYALLCSAYAKSDLELEADKEEDVYQMQFGQES